MAQISDDEFKKEIDLRFWEFHTFAPNLIMQRQDVLINKWTLQS